MKALLLVFFSSFALAQGELPDLNKTPGVARAGLTTAKICSTKWGADRRHVTPAMKREVCRLYGVDCSSGASAFLAQPLTASAQPSSVVADPGVLVVKGMTARTMRTSRLLSEKASAASNVLLVRNRFKMSGIDAGGDSTEMIELVSGRDRTAQNFINQHMGALLAEATVAAALHPVAFPDPTVSELDAPFKRLGQSRIADGSVSEPIAGPIAQTHCTGDPNICRDGVEIDHLISRELGGADDIKNLWPQPWKSARLKDKLENRLHKEVCAGRITLKQAQAMLVNDWRIAYRRYYGEPQGGAR